VRDSDEIVVCGRDPQHNVGKREVGKKLPVADEEMDPLYIGLIGTALVRNEV
jgi:hypothetical protein